MNEHYLEQLKTEVTIRNLTVSTGKTYFNYVKYFLGYTGKEASEISLEEVRQFLLFKKSKGITAATLNLYNSSIRFFFRHVLHELWDDELVPRMKVDRHLPAILTQEEIQKILDSTMNLKHKTMIATMYSSGLRVSEVCRLHYDDISRSNMHIHIRHSKSRRDRYTILSKRNLDLLTQYWYQCGKPKGILFPSNHDGGYIDKTSVNQFVKRTARDAGITKKISCHTYHMTNKAFMGIKSPFDLFGGESNE